MARIYGEIESNALMTFDKSFARANGQPLDSTELFYSKSSAETYAATDIAYVGQKIVVIENNTVTHYSIEADNSLKELGACILGDDLSIVLDGSVLSLKNFNKRYYAYNSETGEYSTTPVEGFKAGLVPRIISTTEGKFELAWFEPSTTTVEDVSALVSALQKSVEANTQGLSDINDRVDDMYSNDTIDQKIAEVEAKIVEDTYPEWSEIAPAE